MTEFYEPAKQVQPIEKPSSTSIFSKFGPILLLLLLSATGLYLRHGELIRSFGTNKVLEGWYDGYKGYMVMAYHARYDSTYTFYAGMNYPYREHVIPAATQPVVANTMRLLYRNGIDLTDEVFTVMHVLLLLAQMATALLLFLLFQQLKIPWAYAIPVALGLSFLAPQTERMVAHFGLAHPWVLPGTFLSLWFLEKGKRLLPGGRIRLPWLPTLGLLLVISLASAIHFYYFAIVAGPVTVYFFVSWWWNRSWPNAGRHLLHYGVAVVLPLVLFMLWIESGQPADDRTARPWGFFFYRSEWESVFLSLQLPFFQWLDTQVVEIRRTQPEGYAYVGAVAVLFSLFVVLRWLFGFWKRSILNFLPETPTERHFLYGVFWAGLLLLLFSFGLPFLWLGKEAWVLDLLGPLGQFRSIGRFAWVFYYAVNILAFVAVWRWARRLAPGWKWSVLGTSVLLLAYEAIAFTNLRDLEPRTVWELNRPERAFTQIDSVDFTRYQAILPIPYYNIGSDNYADSGDGFAVQKSLTIGYETGLPTTAAMLTRTSQRQAMLQMQLVGEPYRQPPILADYPSEKPLLLVWHEHMSDDHRRRYAHLIDSAQLIYHRPPLRLYELPINSFRKRIEWRKRRLRERTTRADLFAVRAFRYTDSLQNFVYAPMNDGPAEAAYFGGGGHLVADVSKRSTVWEGMIPNAVPGREYQLLLWFYTLKDHYPATRIHLEELAPNGQVRQQKTYIASFIIDLFDPAGWTLQRGLFHPVAVDSRYRISVENPDVTEGELRVDELLMLPTGDSLFRATDDYLWFDNRYFPN